jgi:hypothetical protein
MGKKGRLQKSCVPFGVCVTVERDSPYVCIPVKKSLDIYVQLYLKRTTLKWQRDFVLNLLRPYPLKLKNLYTSLSGHIFKRMLLAKNVSLRASSSCHLPIHTDRPCTRGIVLACLAVSV